MTVTRQPAVPVPTLVLIVLATMLAFYGFDKFLAAQEQNELAAEARDHYAAGARSLHNGKPGAAIVDFKRAHTLERSNREYELALATALLANHQLIAAHDALADLLSDDSNDGRANLLMARVLAADGKFKDSDSYYHRAIYGSWLAHAPGEPSKVRLELAEMLAQHGSSQELLSETLLLQSSSPEDPATRKQIADLFLKAGSPGHAVDAYRQLIRENPNDIEAYRGLGRAETRSGNYRAAESAVMAALRRQPYDTHIQSQLRLVVRLASLDPTIRRLSTAEKYRRSVEILALVQSELAACKMDPHREEAEKIPGPVTNEMSEARLDEAVNLWNQRDDACNKQPAPDDPLPLLMAKLSQ